MGGVHPEGRAVPLTSKGQSGSTGPYLTDTVQSRNEWPLIPGYEILGELGHGGMGVVYKARQVSLGRLVALKMILAGTYARPHDLARFRTEVRAVAHLQHPHIVQFYDAGEHDGKPYFALEFLGGGSLARNFGGRPLKPRQAAQLVKTLAGAMQYAHQRGIVHRDLKPSNVLLTEEGIPKITDFGLAKQLEADSTLTQSGTIIGTPSYMAPEQARGETKDIGPLVDVYALGAILYELLTGRPPFRAHTPVDTILQVRSEKPVPPSRLQPAVPRTLEAVCLKCLHKEPGKRYTHARTLGEDLQRFLVGEPVLALPITPLQRATRWTKRNRRPILLSAGVAACCLAAIIILFMTYQLRLTPSGAALDAGAAASMSDQPGRFSKLQADSSQAPSGPATLATRPTGPLVLALV